MTLKDVYAITREARRECEGEERLAHEEARRSCELESVLELERGRVGREHDERDSHGEQRVKQGNAILRTWSRWVSRVSREEYHRVLGE